MKQMCLSQIDHRLAMGATRYKTRACITIQTCKFTITLAQAISLIMISRFSFREILVMKCFLLLPMMKMSLRGLAGSAKASGKPKGSTINPRARGKRPMDMLLTTPFKKRNNNLQSFWNTKVKSLTSKCNQRPNTPTIIILSAVSIRYWKPMYLRQLTSVWWTQWFQKVSRSSQKRFRCPFLQGLEWKLQFTSRDGSEVTKPECPRRNKKK